MDNEGGEVSGEKARKLGDTGGATKYGISLAFLKKLNLNIADINCDGVIDEKDIMVLTYEQAKELYYRFFYNPLYESIIYEELAFRLFDFGINAGPPNAVILLQKSVNTFLKLGTLKEDGVFGIRTLGVVNTIPPVATKTIAELSYEIYRFCIREFYATRKNKAKFYTGWINRLNRTLNYFKEKFRRKNL